MISVLIADAQRLLAETLAISLACHPDITVIDDQPTRGQAAIDAVLHYRPDVSLVDFWIGGMEGPAVVRAILNRAPELKILLLSWFAGPQHVQKSLQAGAVAFLPKSVGVPDVVQAIRKARSVQSPALSWPRQGSGGEGPDRSETPTSLQGLNALTSREIEILSGLRTLGGIGQVAEKMSITPGTVRNHVQSILKKLSVHSQLEAIALARRHGII